MNCSIVYFSMSLSLREPFTKINCLILLFICIAKNTLKLNTLWKNHTERFKFIIQTLKTLNSLKTVTQRETT